MPVRFMAVIVCQTWLVQKKSCGTVAMLVAVQPGLQDARSQGKTISQACPAAVYAQNMKFGQHASAHMCGWSTLLVQSYAVQV